jgi:hypothetical protein
MRISFRQGLISFQRDNGVPAFIGQSSASGFLSHIVSQTPTVIAFAHGGSDYLMHFDRTVDQAWGPMVPGVANYLFWDLDVLSAEISYGITAHPPITAVEAPPAIEGQHWFDLNTHTMKVWSTSRNKWVTKIRVFAGVCPTGNTSVVNHYSEDTDFCHPLVARGAPYFHGMGVQIKPMLAFNCWWCFNCGNWWVSSDAIRDFRAEYVQVPEQIVGHSRNHRAPGLIYSAVKVHQVV